MNGSRTNHGQKRRGAMERGLGFVRVKANETSPHVEPVIGQKKSHDTTSDLPVSFIGVQSVGFELKAAGSGLGT